MDLQGTEGERAGERGDSDKCETLTLASTVCLYVWRERETERQTDREYILFYGNGAAAHGLITSSPRPVLD